MRFNKDLRMKNLNIYKKDSKFQSKPYAINYCFWKKNSINIYLFDKDMVRLKTEMWKSFHAQTRNWWFKTLMWKWSLSFTANLLFWYTCTAFGFQVSLVIHVCIFIYLIKRYRIPKGQSKMDNPEKLAT